MRYVNSSPDTWCVPGCPQAVEVQSGDGKVDVCPREDVSEALCAVCSAGQDLDPARVQPPFHDGGDVLDLLQRLKPAGGNDGEIGQVSVDAAMGELMSRDIIYQAII